MTIMFCQACHTVAECKVESPQPTNRSVYFENPYMNVYVRVRTCTKCGESFKTYELGEPSFMAMRKCVEMSDALGKFIEQTWTRTRQEFNDQWHSDGSEISAEEERYERELQKEPSYLGTNVVSIFRNRARTDEN